MLQKTNQSRRPSIWLGVPIVLVLITVWTNTEYPLDYWLHVTNGRWMVEHQQWITTDAFSHTIEGQPVRNQPWLAQVAMYGLHAVGGYALNQFIAGCCYAAAVAIVIWIAARRCGNWTLAAGLGIVAFAVLASNLGVRPQYFSVVLFAIQLLILFQVRRPIAVPLGCFLILAAWTNLHGAFPVGVALPAIMAVAAWFTPSADSRIPRLRRLLTAVGASIAGCFVRPFPGETVGYVLNVGSRSVHRGLEEWLPTSLGTESGLIFFASLLVVLTVLGMSRRRTSLLEHLLLVAFFVLAVSSQRMLLWWGLILPVAVARPADHVWRCVARTAWCRKWIPQQQPTSADRGISGVLAAVAILYLCGCTPWMRPINRLLPPIKRTAVPFDEPTELVSHFAMPSGPVRTYAPLPWGSYLSWHTGGRLKSFLDSRVDFFPDSVWEAFLEIRDGGPRALELLDQFQVDVVVCGAQEAGLERVLHSSQLWQLTNEGELSRVFNRRNVQVR